MVIARSIFISLFLISGLLLGQDARLSARADTGIFQIGSWIDIHVTGNLSEAIDSISPAVKDSLGPCEVIKVERDDPEPHWLIRLTTIDTGQVFLPPIEFRYTIKNDTTMRRAFTNSLRLNIAGIAVNPESDIKDIKGPMYAPWLFEDLLPYLILLLVIVAISLGYFYYLRNRRQKKEFIEAVKASIPPHREALAALRQLEEKRLWQQGRVKEYYSEATEIVRLFFERRWTIIALELTSAEILDRIKLIPDAMKVWKEMESFFLTADMVKFAKYQPSPEEHLDEMRMAYEIVRAMVPKAPVPVESQNQEVSANAG